MARWKNDIQNRDYIDKITEKIELPLYKPNAKGKLRDWLRESWEKIEDNFLELEKETNKKEPTIDKKTGFNLDKTDNYNQDDTNLLGTAKALKALYDALNRKIDNLDLCPYKIGDVYVTTNTANPANIWIGTKWTKLEGRFLKATNSGEAPRTLGGSNLKTLAVENIPAHNHSINIVANGNHTHTQAPHIHTQPPHKHKIAFDYEGGSSMDGAAWNKGNRYGYTDRIITSSGGENTGQAQPAINAGGNHTHSATIGNTGIGRAFDVTPAYYAVNMWIRIS